MRLLKREEKSGWFAKTYDFSLTEFNPKNIPSQYAIFSHRWGQDEVTFKDLENGTAKTKAGYKKLEFCGEQAARDSLLYFWIDTCCIDKANSTELSEAINSMFMWYQNATKCYAYLPDVSIHDSDNYGSVENKWESAFQKSEWFTRGWTLQELISPRVVEFFSMEGKQLGNKRSLERQIHQITGIAIEALQGESLHQFSVEERLSWTARRQTTIEEDAAYCLLGIFNIHMPLIYGEGRHKALDRLQREIQTSSNPASFAAIDAPWIVPFERNPYFTSREAQLAELENKLFAKDHTSRIAVTGLGGIGKTQLVLELIYRTKEKHKECSIIWIPATNTESLHQGYLVVARQLGIPGLEEKNTDVKKLVQDHLSREDVGQWLIVFDNADDIDIWMAATPILKRQNVEGSVQRSLAGSRRLIDYLPKNKRGCIIFTTRDRKAAVKLAQQNIIEMPDMSEKAATELLKKGLARPDLVDNLHDATALLKELTYLPLAITQAAAYINENGITLIDYLSLLKETEEVTIDLLSEDFEDSGRYQDVRNPVATTWLISFEQIRKHDPLAVEYLSFIACISPKDIPQSLLPPGPSRKREIQAIDTLTAYSFVNRRPADSTLDLHRLVHLATRNWLRKEELLSQWTEKTITHLEEVFPDNDHKNRSIWRTYLLHVHQALESDLISEDSERRVVLMQRYASCLYADGRWNESEKLQSQVMEIRKTKLGADHLDTLSSIAELASTLWCQGRWDEAEKLDAQVMEIRKTKLGAAHPHTLSGMANLASTYRHQGRWDEAEKLEVQVMEIHKTKLGADHPDTLSGMANLASTYWKQGRWDEAEKLDVQVMEIRKKDLGANHPETLTSMNNLAFTWRTQGRVAEAIQLMKDCVQRRANILGIKHPYFLSSHVVLGEWEAELSEIGAELISREDVA